MNELAMLTNPATARLPASYEAARHALANCSQIDECREWANRAEALASYARQSEDATLLNAATRIKARAVDRCGELLREIPPGNGARTDLEPRVGTHPRLTRLQAATNAGLSPHQTKQALRVNNVPKAELDALIESVNPPTIEQLAERGKRARSKADVVDYLQGRNPADFEQATRLLGLLRYIAERAETINPAAAARGVDDKEKVVLLEHLKAVDSWLLSVWEEI